MRFEQLNDGACRTYLVASDGEALLVDPLLTRVDAYLARLAAEGLTLRAVVDTHVHADHLSGCAELRDRTGCDYVMHALSAAVCANVRVEEGDTIRVGGLAVRVLHTPGHTADSVTLALPDRLLTGDFLFLGAGGAGRTDLPGGDAGEHWDALQKLRGLPDDLMVFPGHDYHGRDASTLGAERRENERLRHRTRDDYVRWLGELRLGPAAWMADVIRANYACTREPDAVHIPDDAPACEVGGTAGHVGTETVRTVNAEALRQELEGPMPPTVIDVRRADELLGELGAFPNAVHVPVADLTRRMGELDVYRDRPVVTVCRSGGRSATAAALLSLAGFADVRALEGGMRRWNALGLPVVRRETEPA